MPAYGSLYNHIALAYGYFLRSTTRVANSRASKKGAPFTVRPFSNSLNLNPLRVVVGSLSTLFVHNLGVFDKV
jgi:hypothetical protein